MEKIAIFKINLLDYSTSTLWIPAMYYYVMLWQYNKKLKAPAFKNIAV